MPEDDAPSSTDTAASADGSEEELEDLATLDVDATVDEVMTAVHWIEDHTPGLGTESEPAVLADPIKPARRKVSATRV
jgi:hypothetical protein